MNTTYCTAVNPASCLPKLYDYTVERALLDMAEICGDGGKGLPLWRQQVQYAVGHTLNDYYSLAPEVRRQTPIQFILERRWPPQSRCFLSHMHYLKVKNTICDELIRLVGGNHEEEIPFMLYEQWHVPVPELQMELSMIFQLVWHSRRNGSGLKVQKFMVCGNEEVVLGFLHMANVFCRKAYGMPPVRVEIHFLMEGEKRSYEGDSFTLEASLDYLRLLSCLNGESSNSSADCAAEGDSRSRSGEDALSKHLLM
ncbi:hypothetical protein [Paenibacillus sp. URB8-2]|uniref:hypothetical protein n=1 Tax=Paenibacillus sp. URB8-2 TaxID=2741301 RepID=UPI0015BCE46E|nr:hypothetical protein [Paenibacillus sp. URB8-2]BCG59822.1 hypothetical protein PUR_32470 [Paenibacillus sp. URB8-2]